MPYVPAVQLIRWRGERFSFSRESDFATGRRSCQSGVAATSGRPGNLGRPEFQSGNAARAQTRHPPAQTPFLHAKPTFPRPNRVPQDQTRASNESGMGFPEVGGSPMRRKEAGMDSRATASSNNPRLTTADGPVKLCRFPANANTSFKVSTLLELSRSRAQAGDSDVSCPALPRETFLAQCNNSESSAGPMDCERQRGLQEYFESGRGSWHLTSIGM